MSPLGPIRFLTIHCTATIEGRDHRAFEVSKWDIQRFGQVSYHHVIELDGTAVLTLADTVKGAHVGGHNTGNIGVSYVGGLGYDGKPKDTRTAAQRAAMATLVRQYKIQHPGIVIRGHRDWSPDLNHDGVISPNEYLKACPAFDVAAWLKQEGI